MKTKAVCERHLEKIQDIADKVRTNVQYGKNDPKFVTDMMNRIDTFVEYLEDLISQDPEKYASSFRKDDSTLSPEELAKKEKSREKSRQMFDTQIQQLEDQFGTIQNHIDEFGASEDEVVGKIKSFVG